MASSWFFVIFMAVVQGITEFLPISSSGHLTLLGRLSGFDPEANVTFDIILHAGTLLAIIIYYLRDLFAIVKNYDFRLVGQLIIATVPVGIIGAAIKLLKLDETLFNNLFVPGIGFLVTATLLFATRKAAAGKPLEKLTHKQSLLIGLAQGIAALPGISRSGATIAAGLEAGLEKADAARFSFLMAIPAIGGVAAVELLLLLKKGEPALHSLNAVQLAAGFAIAVIVGYFSLRLLLKLLQRGDFKYFAWYLYVLGAVTLVWAIADAWA
ncbi:MAG: undecaprenyl-diphosphate phosphatase [Victivallaceae bacterium]|nr:undecaprenyl-diphosphate phosphatase [Victivallaceae bacterium]